MFVKNSLFNINICPFVCRLGYKIHKWILYIIIIYGNIGLKIFWFIKSFFFAWLLNTSSIIILVRLSLHYLLFPCLSLSLYNFLDGVNIYVYWPLAFWKFKNFLKMRPSKCRTWYIQYRHKHYHFHNKSRIFVRTVLKIQIKLFW